VIGLEVGGRYMTKPFRANWWRVEQFTAAAIQNQAKLLKAAVSS
jgi:hypothetical protein